MRTVLSVLAVTVGLLPLNAQEKPSNDAAKETKKVKNVLVGRVAQKWEAVRDKDAEALAAILDDGWEAVYQNHQRVTRAQYLKALENKGLTIKDLRLTDHTVKMVTKDVAVITYRVHRVLVLKRGSKGLLIDNLESGVWVNRGGEWRESFVQEAAQPSRK